MEIPHTNQIIHVYSPWTYVIAFGSCLLYLLAITLIFPLFTSKLTPNFVRSFAKLHHVLLFIYSLFASLAVLTHLIQSQETTNGYNFLCVPIPSWLRIVTLTFTLSKIWEWLDTAILIWKGHSLKKIGFLHIYHHATTVLLFLVCMNFPGGEKGSVFFNGLVHTLMYYHFAFRLPKFFRPVLTAIQIVQLITATYVWYIVPNVCPKYRDFPAKHPLEFIIPFALVPVYCLFFFKFFIQHYLLPWFRKSKPSINKTE
ncbi:unnamed protein product [Adineta ricciae]|uniref:Elongation of very long chain fatty acids protein n=1 Tax=Adineta ricciae TaxID=249248 RepID=A0A814GI26_ADIRI|nr:unnamed protein product [Adineta ricciae]